MRLALHLVPRIGATILTLFGVAAPAFPSLRYMPGGCAGAVPGPFATPEAPAAGRGGGGREALRASAPDFTLGSVPIFAFSVDDLRFRVGG